MRNVILLFTTVFALAFSSVAALAADTAVEGTVSGYTCVVLGKACPVDREDPVIAAEKLFVVVKPDGTYYMVPNVDRAILARHLTEKVRVVGTLDDRYKSVQAKTLAAYNPAKDSWKTVWSLEMEAEARKLLERD